MLKLSSFFDRSIIWWWADFFLVTHALNYALVAYAISVKRLWSLWTVLLAGALLKENIKKRLIATLIMLAGVFLIAFAG